MTGTYSSVQQARQEQAAPDAESASPHAVLDLIVTRRADGHLDVRIVQEHQTEIGHEIWIHHAGHLFRPQDSLFTRVEVREDGLDATISAGSLAHPKPYRMLPI